MSLFMDVHADLGDATAEDVAAAHLRDIEVQGKHGVEFLTYWLNSPDGSAYCLVDAPNQAAAIACHKEAHGLIPHNMIEVSPQSLSQHLGEWKQNVPNQAMLDGPGSSPDTGLRAIVFTDIEGSTQVSSTRGDKTAMEMVRTHNEVTRAALAETGGREVKHTGDGIFASFSFVTKAVECSIAIQRGLSARREERPDDGFSVRIGVGAGEPVTDGDDLYGAAVNLAARICGHALADQIVVSGAVRELSLGKSFEYVDLGFITLKGFDEPKQLFELAWI